MDYPKPSVFKPFNRLFTDERAREIEETRQLYEWVRVRQERFSETPLTIGRRVYPYFQHLSDGLQSELAMAMYDIIIAEKFMLDLPEPDFGRMNMREFVEYRNLLYAKQYFFTNQAALLQLFHEGLVRTFAGFVNDLPQTEAPSPFEIPLIYTLPEPGPLIEKTYGTLRGDQYADRGLFRGLTDALGGNILRASGMDSPDSKKPIKHAGDSTLPLDEMADTYLAGTPFHAIFKQPVPLKLSEEDRFNHMHIVGGTGAGKTSLIENLILHDIRSDDPPSIVLIDPTGDVIKRLLHADLGIEDRLVFISPRDINSPPALNIFALNQERLGRYDETTREQVTAGVIQTLEYCFSGLTNLALTGKQATLFRYTARLMLAIPEAMGRNATIRDMIRLMSDIAPFEDAINSLPDIPYEFFTTDFNTKTFASTREEVRYRLQALIENPTLARLFTSPDTKVDLFTELNRGSIILVDTAKDFLKATGSANFGRIFISLVLQAVLERAAIPEHLRKSTHIYIDECAAYFDSNVDDLLVEIRKYKDGLTLAHQYMDQCSSSLRASLAANTGAKFASSLSSSDARFLAPDMRTTPDFILGQPRLQFAAHIRGVTPHAVSIPVKPGALANLPKLSASAFDRLMERNKARVSLPLALPSAHVTPRPPFAPPRPSKPHVPFEPAKHKVRAASPPAKPPPRQSPFAPDDDSDEW